MVTEVIRLDDTKDAELWAARGVGLFHIERGDLLDIPGAPSPDLYAGQRIFVVRRDD